MKTEKKGWYVYYNTIGGVIVLSEGLTYSEAVVTTLWYNKFHPDHLARWGYNV